MVRLTRGPDGVLVVDKPRGRTSHDIVADARRLFATRAVGHAGTLDPMATGVLVLLFGEACKLSTHLTNQSKAYRASVRFGVGTDSLDAGGRITQTCEVPAQLLSEETLTRALDIERQREQQIPPSVSAIHDRGERAHVRARRGETLELAPRSVRVEALTMLAVRPPNLEIELRVSKGYYVRALARDLGTTLGVPAHLDALRRLSSGPFTLEEACAWPPTSAPPLLATEAAARRALPVTLLSEEGARFARHGKQLRPEHAQPASLGEVSAWLGPGGQLVALGISEDASHHRVLRGFSVTDAA